MPTVGYFKIHLDNFQTNEYASIRFFGYSDFTGQAADTFGGSYALGVKIHPDKIEGGDFSSSAITSKTQIDIDNQNYMFTEVYFAMQRNLNNKRVGIIVNSKEYLALNLVQPAASDHKNMIEIMMNSDAGTVQLDRISLAGPNTPSSKKSLTDSFPDDNNLDSLSNTEHYKSLTHPFTKNPQNPILPDEGYNIQYVWSALREGNTMHSWVHRASNSNGPYYNFHASTPYPITQDFSVDAEKFIDTGDIVNREMVYPMVFLDDDGYYKAIFSDYRCYTNRTWKNDDYGGVGLAIGGKDITDDFDIYPNAVDPLWLLTRRGDINPMGELPDSPRITKTTGLNPDEKYLLYIQSKYDNSGDTFRDFSIATGSDPYNFKVWPTGNVPLPINFLQIENAHIIQRDIDDYIMIMSLSPGNSQAVVSRSRSPYYWPPVLFYNDLANLGEWDDKVGFSHLIPNEDLGIFDTFYTGNSTDTGHATMRIDGFDWVSLSSGQNSGDTRTVAIERPSTGWNQLKLNIDQVSANDTLKVEILNAATNNPISGFAVSDADPITSDNTKAIASWDGNTSLKSITGNIKLNSTFQKLLMLPDFMVTN